LEQPADESCEAPAVDGGEGVVDPAHNDLAEVLDAGGREGGRGGGLVGGDLEGA